MEEDGGQGGDIAKEMGAATLALALIPLGTGAASVIGAVPGAIAAAKMVGVGLALELIGWNWSSSDADDPVGDVILWFTPTDICSGFYSYLTQEVATGGNEASLLWYR